ncbi:DUF1194 domain-containing protein [Frigidibacter sp. MR17.14]|uniref:DUF1194 domain-containing protein n=1 Tax=Frigidibacter sp. MR17.14 TaxID=3126509 RepID=UPI003012E999
MHSFSRLVAIGTAVACGCLIAALPDRPSRAATRCDVALVLAIDVSGSIDTGEYRLQTDGLSLALSDPDVVSALVSGGAAVTVMHWSSVFQQQVVIPWRRVQEPADVEALARDAAVIPRSFTRSDTAPGEMIATLPDLFATAPACARKVADISGDGPVNAGRPVPPESKRAQEAGITLNAIAIEDRGGGNPITEFYRRYVITPDGFVLTARGLGDYAPVLRKKLLRELVIPTG